MVVVGRFMMATDTRQAGRFEATGQPRMIPGRPAGPQPNRATRESAHRAMKPSGRHCHKNRANTVLALLPHGRSFVKEAAASPLHAPPGGQIGIAGKG